MSNLVSPLLGADNLVFKPLLDQEPAQPATNTISVRENSNLSDFTSYTIVVSDIMLLPAAPEQNIFQKLDLKDFLKTRHSKDNPTLGEETGQVPKLIIDDISFELVSSRALEDDGADSTSPKWPIKLSGPKDEPDEPNNEELVCVMPGYRDPHNKSNRIESEQEVFIPPAKYQSELSFNDWIDVLF